MKKKKTLHYDWLPGPSGCVGKKIFPESRIINPLLTKLAQGGWIFFFFLFFFFIIVIIENTRTQRKKKLQALLQSIYKVSSSRSFTYSFYNNIMKVLHAKTFQ